MVDTITPIIYPEDPIFNKDIQLDILDYLQGWIITTETNNNYNLNGEINPLLDTNEKFNFDKKITEDELKRFFQKAIKQVKSYTNRPYILNDPSVYEAINCWCAGLLWRKYNIRSRDNIDETNTLGYGDELIIKAKQSLKRFIKVDIIPIG